MSFAFRQRSLTSRGIFGKSLHLPELLGPWLTDGHPAQPNGIVGDLKVQVSMRWSCRHQAQDAFQDSSL